MKVHVYRVTEKYVVDNSFIVDEAEALQEALNFVKAGRIPAEGPECEFIAVVPGGQETTDENKEDQDSSKNND